MRISHKNQESKRERKIPIKKKKTKRFFDAVRFYKESGELNCFSLAFVSLKRAELCSIAQ